ncbi:hypothetical protein [Zobellella sp. DQSA1]|uniref:hypothetical protein n=1 Tax=Zobellella sp. DQSA1 TaxID=3342386 RepID=UPI0035C12274
MASGGSYVIDETGQRVLRQRSGHRITSPPAAPAKQQKAKPDADTQKSAADRG